MAKKEEKKIATLKDLRSKFGRPDTVFIDTKIPQINDLWGGGLPTGKVIEVHSESGLGKTTFALQISKALIEQGHKVAYLDVEHALDDDLKRKMGVLEYENDDQEAPTFNFLSPSTFSEVEDTMEYILSKGYKFVVFDSLTSAIPDKRAAGSITDILPGSKAALQAIFLEQYKARLARLGVTLYIINQMRTNINFIRSTVEPAGGKGIQYYTDIRTAMRRKDWIEENKQRVGIELVLLTIKNKLTQPFRKVNLKLYFGKGIDIANSYLDLMLERGIISQSGAFFTVPKQEKALQGRVGVLDWMKKNEKLVKELVKDSSELVNEGIEEA